LQKLLVQVTFVRHVQICHSLVIHVYLAFAAAFLAYSGQSVL